MSRMKFSKPTVYTSETRRKKSRQKCSIVLRHLTKYQSETTQVYSVLYRMRVHNSHHEVTQRLYIRRATRRSADYRMAHLEGRSL